MKFSSAAPSDKQQPAGATNGQEGEQEEWVGGRVTRRSGGGQGLLPLRATFLLEAAVRSGILEKTFRVVLRVSGCGSGCCGDATMDD